MVKQKDVELASSHKHIKTSWILIVSFAKCMLAKWKQPTSSVVLENWNCVQSTCDVACSKYSVNSSLRNYCFAAPRGSSSLPQKLNAGASQALEDQPIRFSQRPGPVGEKDCPFLQFTLSVCQLWDTKAHLVSSPQPAERRQPDQVLLVGLPIHPAGCQLFKK